jgi:hypothetical protein
MDRPTTSPSCHRAVVLPHEEASSWTAPPRLGTDGAQDRIPQSGDAQARADTGLALYVGLLACAALGVGVLLIGTGHEVSAPIVVFALAVSIAIAERWSIQLSSTTELSVYLLPTVFAAVAIGPLSAALIAAASMLGDQELLVRGHPERAPRFKWVAYTSTRFLTGALAGLVAALVLQDSRHAVGGLIAATFSAMAVGEAVDFAFAATTTLVRRRSVRALVLRAGPVALTSFLVYAPVVVGLAVAYAGISPWTILLFIVPTLALQRMYAVYQRERRLADELRFANETLAQANLSFAAALVATLDARDRYTAGHSAAVAIYSRDIASRLGLEPEMQHRAYLSGLVHDIGKIGLPPGLLEKEGALTLAERRLMQEHSVIGERILANVDDYLDIAGVVRHHHERIDGEGYPDRLRGEEIPLLSRIIAVADAYNAMTSDRPYRDAMPSRVARLRLAQAVESQFDTSVVAAFEAILASRDEDYRTARRSEFSFFGGNDHQSAESEPPFAIGAVA